MAPSYEEGWGISVCEALASSLPVVAYRLSTLDELFGDAYAGVPLGDRDALATVVAGALHDDNEVRRLSSKARRTAERYDLTTVAERELEWIQRAIVGEAISE